MAIQQEEESEDGLPIADNPERGCGYLKEGKAYLRSHISPDGVLPAFVRFEEPIPFLEGHLRGYSYFPGVQFELQVTPTAEGYHDAGVPNVTIEDALGEGSFHNNAIETLSGTEPEGSYWTTTTPPLEIERHLERLRWGSDDGDHIGEMRTARAHDLLMWVGESYYPDPEDFIGECERHGLSKAIPTSENQKPPVINPGRTRVFLVHPAAIRSEHHHDEAGEPRTIPGIIGYAYVTDIIYTGISTADDRRADVDFPGWAREYAESDYFELVKIGPRIPNEQQGNTSIDEWADAGDDADDRAVAIEELTENGDYHDMRSELSEHGIEHGENPSKVDVAMAIVDAPPAGKPFIAGDSGG